MTEQEFIDQTCLAFYTESVSFRKAGKLVLSDIDEENKVAVQSTLRILASESLLEYTPSQLVELIQAARKAYERGKEIYNRTNGSNGTNLNKRKN